MTRNQRSNHSLTCSGQFATRDSNTTVKKLLPIQPPIHVGRVHDRNPPETNTLKFVVTEVLSQHPLYILTHRFVRTNYSTETRIDKVWRQAPLRTLTNTRRGMKIDSNCNFGLNIAMDASITVVFIIYLIRDHYTAVKWGTRIMARSLINFIFNTGILTVDFMWSAYFGTMWHANR
ncbi:hypothetical protein BC629DRAFT_1438742 [Irpex lacteus]|nr:hypothetical protein BC629DRAFT_1438742 [Irpex lacteus]